MNILPNIVWLNFVVLLAAFVALSKGADWLVDGAVGVAFKLAIPKIIIGIVLVSFGTTMPEFTVSVISAVQGHSEIALGNAVGSVIVNVAVALGLGVLFAPKLFKIERDVYRSVGITFFAASVITFVLAMNGRIGRIEGGVLLACLAVYMTYVVVTEKRRKAGKFEREAVDEVEAHPAEGTVLKFVGVFGLGLAVVIVASRFLVASAVNIAHHFDVSETIIGLTIIAIGTSLPEVATCIVASRKGHGELAFGDIMGANILNLLWILGGASVAGPIVVTQREIFFMFPFMITIVGAMYLMTRFGYKLNKWNATVLIAAYVGYAITTVLFFVVDVVSV